MNASQLLFEPRALVLSLVESAGQGQPLFAEGVKGFHVAMSVPDMTGHQPLTSDEVNIRYFWPAFLRLLDEKMAYNGVSAVERHALVVSLK